jgi:hypothetical protein
MTGALDTRMRSLAQRLTDKFGKAVVLREFAGNTFDPSTGQNTASYTDHNANAVVRSYAERLIDGSSVQVGDLEVSVPAKDLTFVPDTQDRLRMDGVEYAIVNPQRTYSGEQVALYVLQVRR